MPEAFVGNKREVPPDMPVLFWRDLVLQTEATADLGTIPWHHELLEYLSPEELRRIRAKALIWFTATGEWPEEIAWWWEVRMARRRGAIPHRDETALVRIDESGVLTCGKCEARWSADAEGRHPDRCKLCDVTWLVLHDERKETHGSEAHDAQPG